MTDTTETVRQYAERDIMALDKIGGHYSRHVAAMTAEGLHAKSDIAAELAYRDAEIARLRAEHAKLLGFVRSLVKYFQTGVTAWSLLDLASVHEIISAEAMSSPCREDCKCRKAGVFPTLCYRLAEFLRAP